MDNNQFEDEDFEFEEFTPAFPIDKNNSNSDEKNNTLSDGNIFIDNSSEKNIVNNNLVQDILDDKDLMLNNNVDKNILSDINIGNKQDKEELSKKKKMDNLISFASAHARILPVIAFSFVSILGIYIFINNVKADVVNLIKIEEKSKVGYINKSGDVVVKPKYLYGTDYYKGYAIVKNYNSLYGILDSKGNTEISFGNIFSATLYDDIYVVSKFTNEGLKMGLLDSNLEEITRFKYDNISYSKSGVFLFTRDETMGLMNKNGKEIYTYKVDEVDDRNISVEVSNLSKNLSSDIYAKIKINESSTILNTNTGKEVYKYTLDDIKVLDNNVFYIKNSSGNNRYFIIKNDKIVYETFDYLRLRVEDLDSNIAIGIKNDATVDYINLLTKKKINESDSINYTYSDGVIVKELYDFNSDKNQFTISTSDKILGTFENLKPVDSTYVNGYMKIITDNNKFVYLNKKGEIIPKKEYDYLSDFNENGYAVIGNDNGYGVINTKGKEIIDSKYEEIIMLDDELFKNIKKTYNEELFIFKDSNKYGMINGKGKIVVKAIYNDFEIVTTKYPFIKANYNGSNLLINLDTFKDISVEIKDNIEIYENYIVVSGNYYNYDGNLIYSIGG